MGLDRMSKEDYEMLVEQCNLFIRDLEHHGCKAVTEVKTMEKFVKEFMDKMNPEISTQEKII
jgi:hypothetical protein